MVVGDCGVDNFTENLFSMCEVGCWDGAVSISKDPPIFNGAQILEAAPDKSEGIKAKSLWFSESVGQCVND